MDEFNFTDEDFTFDDSVDDGVRDGPGPGMVCLDLFGDFKEEKDAAAASAASTARE